VVQRQMNSRKGWYCYKTIVLVLGCMIGLDHIGEVVDFGKWGRMKWIVGVVAGCSEVQVEHIVASDHHSEVDSGSGFDLDLDFAIDPGGLAGRGISN
jgi:hypothetical protein